MKRVWVLLVLVTFIGFAGTANAELYTIGTASYDSDNNGTAESYNLIYEGQLGGSGLVWLDYSNALNTWSNQVSWASGVGGSLTVTLDPLYTTTINDWTTGWRLPSAGDNPQSGYDQTTSEMGHLYYTSLGKSAGGPLGDTDPFVELQAYFYWSGTEYSPVPGVAWVFAFGDGGQGGGVEGSFGYALAVRPGEVSAVPEPATVLLLGSGLVGLAGLRRRSKK